MDPSNLIAVERVTYTRNLGTKESAFHNASVFLAKDPKCMIPPCQGSIRGLGLEDWDWDLDSATDSVEF